MKPLNQDAITALLPLDKFILDVFPELSSTNDYLKELTDHSAQFRICLASRNLKL